MYVAKIQYKKLASYPQDKYPFKRFIFLKSCSNYYSYYTKYFPFNFYKRDCLRFYFLSIFFSFDKCFHFTKFNYMYIVNILKWQVSYNFCQNRFKYKTFDHSTFIIFRPIILPSFFCFFFFEQNGFKIFVVYLHSEFSILFHS